MRTKQTVLAMLMAALSVLAPASAAMSAAQDATPTMMASCDDAGSAVMDGTPTMTGGMSGMSMGTPMASVDHMEMDLDQIYIDMMIPHHASIIAMAEAALPRLSDERLRAMAQNIIDSQSAEIAELRRYREQTHGVLEPMPMAGAMMRALDELMPGMSGTMEEMAFQMDAAAQVDVICATENADLGFIDLTIPHHQMAIEASETLLEQSVHPEMRDFAARVIAAQGREIGELTAIRQELARFATPASQ